VGNPFDWRVMSREAAVRDYDRALLDGRLTFTVAGVWQALSGSTLVCYCPFNSPCHVDVRLRIANCPIDLSPKNGVTYFQELPKQTAVEPGELAEIGGDAQVEWRDRSPIRSPFGHCGAITKERAAAGRLQKQKVLRQMATR
jgi:hypothetical protein